MGIQMWPTVLLLYTAALAWRFRKRSPRSLFVAVLLQVALVAAAYLGSMPSGMVERYSLAAVALGLFGLCEVLWQVLAILRPRRRGTSAVTTILAPGTAEIEWRLACLLIRHGKDPAERLAALEEQMLPRNVQPRYADEMRRGVLGKLARLEAEPALDWRAEVEALNSKADALIPVVSAANRDLFPAMLGSLGYVILNLWRILT